jgi:hypothetical protein
MALKGNLRDFSTTQLLNLISLARKTGALTIEGRNSTAKLYFKEGKLIHAAAGSQDGQLAQMLLKAGKITAEQARTIQARAAMSSDKELALLLMNAGHVSQNDIIQSVRSYMLELVYNVFTWNDGLFHFEPNALPSEDRITVPVDLENVIMEGSRRIKEYERLQDELPDLNMALKFTDRPDARLRKINLSVEEWRVISFINPRNTIKQIAQSNNMSDFQIRKIVYGMLQAGLVELVRPEGAPLPAAAEAPVAAMAPRPGEPKPKAVVPSPPPPPAVKRGVILRLIDRIKRI